MILVKIFADFVKNIMVIMVELGIVTKIVVMINLTIKIKSLNCLAELQLSQLMTYEAAHFFRLKCYDISLNAICQTNSVCLSNIHLLVHNLVSNYLVIYLYLFAIYVPL